jgi:hypothetical protein
MQQAPAKALLHVVLEQFNTAVSSAAISDPVLASYVTQATNNVFRYCAAAFM